MADIKPIKRSKELAPLSREHHDTLLFTWKVKQGLSNETPVDEIIVYVQWYWDNFLQQHFREEEELLLPFLDETDPLVKQLKTEHESIRKLITASLSKNLIEVLIEKINNHVRFEERQFFPHVEQQLSSVQLNGIYEQLNQQAHCNDQWKNEFWIKKK